MRAVRPAEVVVALVARASVADAHGERHHARSLMAEALMAARAGGVNPTPALQGMAELVAQDGRRDTARRLCEEALELARANGDKTGAARALRGLGELAADTGNVKRAVLLHREALALLYEARRRPEVAATLDAIAGLAGGAGRDEQAARLRGAAAALRGALPDVAGDGACAAAFAAGAALSLEDAARVARLVEPDRDRAAGGGTRGGGPDQPGDRRRPVPVAGNREGAPRARVPQARDQPSPGARPRARPPAGDRYSSR